MQSNQAGEPLLVPVSAGEFLDKKTILEIKCERIQDARQLANVRHELALLAEIAERLLAHHPQAGEVKRLEAELKQVNVRIWDCENKVRVHERSGVFGDDFVATARSTYAANDRRAALKREINALLDSPIVEEKSHS